MNTLPLWPEDGNIPEKQCTGSCKRWLPAIPENFCRDRGGKYGFSARCKVCKAEYNASHREENKISHTKWLKENAEQQKQYNALYHEKHKVQLSKQHKEWLKEHEEQQKQYRVDYLAAHHEERIEFGRQYRMQNHEVMNEKHRRYRQTERGRLARLKQQNNRRARQLATPGTLTTQEIQQKLKAQKYRCYYAACGHAKFKKDKGKYIFHLEHTIPLSRAEHSPRNDVNYVVLACPLCNVRKNDKLPHEWIEGGRLF